MRLLSNDLTVGLVDVATVLVTVSVSVVVRVGGGEVAGGRANDLLAVLSLLAKRVKISGCITGDQICSAELLRLYALMVLVLPLLVARCAG